MHLLRWILFCLFWPLSLAAQDDSNPLQVEGRVEPYRLAGHQVGKLVLDLTLPPGFHAYLEQFRLVLLEPDGFQYGRFELDPVVNFYDKTSKRDRQGMNEKAQMTLVFEAPEKIPLNTKSLIAEVTYQACSKTYCLFPQKKQTQVPFEWSGEWTEPALKAGNAPAVNLSNVWNGQIVQKALNENIVLAFFLVFLAGLLTSFTPCIFPMIPITLAILGHDSQKRTRWQNFLLSLSYVHGIATTYSLLGLLAATSGSLFGSSLGHPVVLGTLCVIFLLMALSMYGVFEIQVPSFMRPQMSKKSSVGLVGAYFSGIVAGVVASPCVGPVLVTLLTFVAATQNKVLGLFLLFSYAMGLGVIFLVLGAFTELTRRLPRSGAWMNGMKFVLGSLMLGAFFYYLSFLLPQRWFDAALGLALIVVASFFGAFLDLRHLRQIHRVQKGLMQGLLAVGIGFIVLAAFDLRPRFLNQFDGPHDLPQPGAQWQPYSESALQEAQALQKPVIIDFFADWCLACHELDQKTFSRSEVQVALKDFLKLRFDATKESPALDDLKKRYKIVGLPTIVFIDSKGQWQEAVTLTAFETPEKFIKRVQKSRALEAGDL